MFLSKSNSRSGANKVLWVFYDGEKDFPSGAVGKLKRQGVTGTCRLYVEVSSVRVDLVNSKMLCVVIFFQCLGQFSLNDRPPRILTKEIAMDNTHIGVILLDFGSSLTNDLYLN